MTTNSDTSIKGREVGRRLRQTQRDAGLLGLDVAYRLGWTPTKVSRALTGARVPTPVEVSCLMVASGLPEQEHRDRMIELVRPYQDNGLHLPVNEAWPVFLAHAGQARRVVEFTPLVLPWVAQTPAYTRALLPDADEWEITSRQDTARLLSLPDIDVEILLPEAAVRARVLDTAGMAEQVHHLLRLSVRRAVHLP